MTNEKMYPMRSSRRSRYRGRIKLAYIDLLDELMDHKKAHGDKERDILFATRLCREMMTHGENDRNLYSSAMIETRDVAFFPRRRPRNLFVRARYFRFDYEEIVSGIFRQTCVFEQHFENARAHFFRVIRAKATE